MAKTLNSNQIEKVDRPFAQPVYLCHFLLSGLTLYFSDRNYTYNSHNYEDYLFSLSGIENAIKNMGGYDNPQITLRFRNEKIRSKNYLIELFDDYPPEKQYVEIYKLFYDSGEIFTSDVSTKIFKGEMGQPYDISDFEFKIDCSSMLFGKNLKLPLDVIDLADYPSADPDDVGKYRNIVYGSVDKLICPWTVAGWVSTLTADITAAALSIVVTDSTTAPATPFDAYIDNEVITVTNNVTATGTLTVTRGSDATTAVAHSKGSEIYEQRTDFEAEVAQHPVKAINDVYARRGSDEWVRVVSGVTKNISIGGRATLVFSDKVKYEEKTAITPTTDTGTHIHTASAAAQYSEKQCNPTGGTNAALYDGNYSAGFGVAGGAACEVTFTETNFGTISKQYCYIYKIDGAVTSNVLCGGTNIGSCGAAAGQYRFVKTGGAWGDNVQVTAGAGGNTIGEMWKVVEYTPNDPTVNTHAADGVDVTLSGNSVANMVIGDIVACDVDGYEDDAGGTYTGVANALIERPDHIRKHILVTLLGFSATDIDASFATVGTIYAGRIASGYKLAFNLPEISTEAMDLFEKIDLQTASNMFESGGKFILSFGLTGSATSQITFNSDNISGLFIFGKTEIADIRNKIRGYYLRDYSKSGALGQKYQKVNERSEAYSISKYGTITEDVEFSCVGDLSAMVSDVLDHILFESRDLKKKCNFKAYWDATKLEACDFFTVTSNFWSGTIFKLIGMFENSDDHTFNISGLEYTGESYRLLIGNCSHSLTVGIGNITQTKDGNDVLNIFGASQTLIAGEPTIGEII